MAANGAASTAPAKPAPGDDLIASLQRELGGEVSVRSEVARDGVMVTFEGVETRQSRPVHVHVVLPAVAAADRDRAQRVLRAARTTAKLRHPRVQPVYRVAAGDRLCWYLTPPPSGEPLGAVLERTGPLPLERVTEIITQAAAALACAHEQRVVHGGLTASSILLEADGGVVVRDFGMPSADVAAIRDYRAPELDAGSGTASIAALTGMSAAADQYALGILAWQMITGRTPGTDRLPPLATVRPDLPPAVGTALERATAARPADRHATVGKFAQSLRAAAEGRPSAPQRPALRPRTSAGVLLGPEPAPEGASPIAHMPEEKPRRRPVRRPVILGALGGATALALVAMLAWRSGNDDELSPAERQRLEAAARFYGAQPVAAEEPVLPPPAPTAPPASAEPAPAPVAATPPVTRRRGESPHQAAQRTLREAQQRRESAASARAIAANTAWVTIGTNPQAAIFINETPVPTNPVINWPVRSGRVFLRFEVLDASSGVWTRDMVVNVSAGDTLNLRRIRLTRP